MAPAHPPLYDAAFERAACGLGFIARVDGQRSHEIVEQGLEILRNLAHRGASGSDPETGDGAGLLLQIPDAFLRRECRRLGIHLPAPRGYAVGMIFFSPDDERRQTYERELEEIAAAEGQRVLGWRDVPARPERIGALSRSLAPRVRQVFIERRTRDTLAFERKLYSIRRQLHWAVAEKHGGANDCYVVSLSSRTLVYKGLLRGPQVAEFYPDLTDPSMASALALVHSRFSTNTLGSWPLAHPYRYIAHNGEINTLRGNLNWMRAREHELRTGLLGEDDPLAGSRHHGPIVQPGGSDTSAFDNALEFLVLAGRSLPHAIMTMVPEAWENDPQMDPNRGAFYQYTNWIMPSWDGPAAMVFSDGTVVGATLDRNGLRPARYSVTRDGLVILASEEGVLPVAPEEVVARWRLQPGRMLLVDTARGQILSDGEVKNAVVRRRPYRRWVKESALTLQDLPPAPVPPTPSVPPVVAEPRLCPVPPVVAEPRLCPVPPVVAEPRLCPGVAGPEGPAERAEGSDRQWQGSATTIGAAAAGPATLSQLQQTFGYTLEDQKLILAPMATHGKEPDGSMGTDTPLAVLSERPQLLFSYFQQLFAQVTNPPIDPLREELVMSLAMSLGPDLNLLDERPDGRKRILLAHPILRNDEIERLRGLTDAPFQTRTLPILFPVDLHPLPVDEGFSPLSPADRLLSDTDGDRTGAISNGYAPADEQRAKALAYGLDDPARKPLEAALEALCREAQRAVEEGTTILILSDRGVDARHAPLPSLLATAAVHHHLVRTGLRNSVSLVVESGEPREVHHLALLVGYGAAAVNPYLAFDTLTALAENEHLSLSPSQAIAGYSKALQKGLLKVISKMGISTLSSYCGAQIFEAVGLHHGLVEAHFTGTSSRIGGVGLGELAQETLARHERAFGAKPDMDVLESGGEYQLRQDGEYHQWNTHSIAALQRAVRTGNFATFQDYTRHFDAESARLATLRGLFALERDPIPLEEVEPEAEIVTRFVTGAMSFGSISREAHETLAIAMNRIGGKSNTGEGGEEPERFLPDANGDSRRSAIKQVASARFGVTTHYLINADVHQIKVAQGSKPGEGGQLPGHKVSEDIARVRHSTPGVGLISPPPHHDIYSIEDLAQLIHDLKNVNPQAQISVKLVAEVGVGTVAAGVSKAKADHITISGHDGGTGASPLSSIKHAGLPWELGLAETQQVLVANDLRGRVVVQADGQLKTGRDVVIAALLGAEEFAFATAPLVATGCIMMRVCHLNTCPVGIATQDPELRRRFAGKPEHVINYFFFIAREVRHLMAQLGFRRFDHMVGRADKLRVRSAVEHWKARGVDLSAILYTAPPAPGVAIRHAQQQDHGLEGALDNELIRRFLPSGGEPRRPEIDSPPLRIANTNRSVGAMLSGELVRRYGPDGLPGDTIQLRFRGTAGQSFGAWAAPGLTLFLEGETNDYVGKGLSGGTIIVTPPPGAGYDPERSIVVGNVALYGATSGEAYFRGIAGERFAVRNSGARAVVEGVGDHGCEYMTGGVVVVLGPTGRNFAAGMSGGTAFVLDLWSRFAASCNLDMVGLEPVEAADDLAVLHHLLQQHLAWTGSGVAQRVLTHWTEYLPRFVKVMPHDLRRVLEAQQREQDAAQDEAIEARAV